MMISVVCHYHAGGHACSAKKPLRHSAKGLREGGLKHCIINARSAVDSHCMVLQEVICVSEEDVALAGLRSHVKLVHHLLVRIVVLKPPLLRRATSPT